MMHKGLGCPPRWEKQRRLGSPLQLVLDVATKKHNAGWNNNTCEHKATTDGHANKRFCGQALRTRSPNSEVAGGLATRWFRFYAGDAVALLSLRCARWVRPL